MKTILSVIMSALIITAAHAQKITGEIKDAQGKALHNASLSLKRSKDSSLVKIAISGTDGKYEFNNIKEGSYFINASAIGHGPFNTASFEVSGNGNTSVPGISLTKTVGQLKEVVISAKKPMIEIKADKTVFNVENSINATGTDALELLRKSPGVMVDKDDNLSLAGKNGVQVYIDGRPSPLSGKDLSDYLKNLQSSSIEAIEIITNPSAKYDAAGNAGIINIKLKKNKSYGANGLVNAGYSIGTYAKYNSGLALNYRNKKVNLFGNYNYNHNLNENHFNLVRSLFDSSFIQQSMMENRGDNHSFKAGMDYFINKKNIIGVMINGNFNDNDFSNYGRTVISYEPTNSVDRILIADNKNVQSRKDLNSNLNYRYVDTAGRELNVDADYGRYRIRSNQLQPNYYYDPSETTLLSSRTYNMIQPADIDIYSLKADYEQNYKKGRLGIGAKSSYVETTNNFERYNVGPSSGIKTLDTLKSNNFNYKENINAIYANYNKQFKGIMVQVGVRMENTNSKGRSTGFSHNGTNYLAYDSMFTRHYTDFFPSAAITFNKNPMSQWGLSYSLRIDRPAYQDLNPFEFKLDEYTYMKGNTNLSPQYTNSFSITHSYQYKLNTKLNYSHVKDVFTQIVDTAEKTKSFMTKKNLATQDIFSINVSYPFQWKWYSVFMNLNAYYSHYKANFGTGRTIDLDVTAFNFYAQNTFKLGKGWTAEVSGFYNSPSIWQGTFKSKEMYGIDGGLQKSLWKGKANIKASVSDIFKTMSWGGVSQFAGQYLHAYGNWESRQFRLNFTYRFGNTQVKAARQRKLGSEEEGKRVQSGGGGLGN
jgi:hypothetical protein